MKKIIINAPIFSSSGYGEMSRFALRCLREHEDKFDIYINLLNWGMTGWISEQSEEYDYINSLRLKTEHYHLLNKDKVHYDISLQITIPNEWKKMADLNIGYTAGIETVSVSPAWFEPCNMMDRIITISEFSKKVFLSTIFEDNNKNKHSIKTPIDFVHFPYKNVENAKLDIDFSAPFNFICVNQWGPRKNMEQLLLAFIEEFREEENVGLVIKTNLANDSQMDRERTESMVSSIIQTMGEKKCKIKLIHGRLTQEEMFGLYRHPKVKAFVTATHGEGFGMPIFEATQAELPVIATDWSGHLDFLSIEDKKMFAKVDYQIAQIEERHVWKGVMEENTGWAYPNQASLRSRMREVYKDYGRFKSWAKKLAEHNKIKFNSRKVSDDFFYSLGLYSKPKIIMPKEITGVSFCIPTNGKRIEKTLKTIKSIRSQEWGNIPYEIIIAGDVENIPEGEDIRKINLKEEAHSKKVALLRNVTADKAQHDAIAWCDDDIILDKNWLSETLAYSKTTGWEVLGNKMFNPDGTRHWDRGTLKPRRLVDYDSAENDNNLIQTSGFFMVRKEVFADVRWDETKLVYADRESRQIPEDVQYSIDLHNKNYLLSFNKNALVWHNDENYTEYNMMTLTLSMVEKILSTKVDAIYSREFKKMEKEYGF